ncbi:MAG TPA: aminotransferase class V-fold PLP-dependent enzyme [Terriglobales bacterium]|nr:aminotransferase class V-fold PLP-dependent enzyme [Terriglobales bacterium]
MREKEFSRLDANGQVYLDYTGAGLYPESLIREYNDWLANAICGNPHSLSPSSTVSTEHVETARAAVLQFFNTSPDRYSVIFTPNASGGLKLIGESYPFNAESRFVLTADNHNSVNGIREFAKSKAASVSYVPLNSEMRVENLTLPEVNRSRHNLFAYPVQSNFTGVKHPLDWIRGAHEVGYDVLLDAAAYVPTNHLDLSKSDPDFVAISFYKMFGFPTGVGAIIGKVEALRKLHRPWFAGGTVRFVSTQNGVHILKTSSEAFEDGTVNFLSIPAITMGLNFLSQVGIKNINENVTKLTELMLEKLHSLRHSNGIPLVKIYGPTQVQERGATVAMNLLSPEKRELDYRLVEERAMKENISIRTGCFCNPGAAEAAFQYPAVTAYQCFEKLSPGEFSLQQFSSCMNDLPVGAVRASLGIASNEADVERFVQLLREFTDLRVESKPRLMPDVVGT